MLSCSVYCLLACNLISFPPTELLCYVHWHDCSWCDPWHVLSLPQMMEKIDVLEKELSTALEPLTVPDIVLEMLKAQKIAMHLQSEIIDQLAHAVRRFIRYKLYKLPICTHWLYICVWNEVLCPLWCSAKTNCGIPKNTKSIFVSYFMLYAVVKISNSFA